MTDAFWEDVELVFGGDDGQTVVDIEPKGESKRSREMRALLIGQFRAITIPVKNGQDQTVAKVEVVECKICGALLRRNSGVLIAHARRHSQERRR